MVYLFKIKGLLNDDHGFADQTGDQEKNGPKNMTIGDHVVPVGHGWSPVGHLFGPQNSDHFSIFPKIKYICIFFYNYQRYFKIC